ncbi:MAG: outer membrane beta-barrel protein [Acidobacteriota bacterium]|nr:outer membrane beta-barrel protein [Acidobacteriota bacterium]
MKSVCLTVFSAMVLLFSPGVSAQDDAATSPDCPKRVQVLVEKVAAQTFSEYKRFVAFFSPAAAVASTAIAGTVTDIKVSDGDLVSEGYVLVVLNEGMDAESKAAETELDQWKKTLWKREHWKERSPAAESQAREKIKEIEERLAEIKARAPETSVLAPQTGTVELLVVPGTEVEAGTPVARVTNPRLKVAELKVEPQDLELFPLGEDIDLGNGIKAIVQSIENDIVRLGVVDAEETFGAQSVSFNRLKLEENDAVVLSKDQVLSDDSGNHVFVVADKYARRADIKCAAQYEGRVLVTSGLVPGDLVITHQLLNRKTGELADSLVCLEDGKPIRVMIQDPESGRFVKFKGELPEPAPTLTGVAPAEPEKTLEPEPVAVEEARPVEPEEPVAAEPVIPTFEAKDESVHEKTWKPSLGIGAGIGLAMMSDEVFKEVYGSSTLSLNFRLIYAFHPRVEAFLDLAYSSMTGTIMGVNAETEIIRAPISLGARYVFALKGNFKPYVGVAAVAFNAKETNEYAPDADYVTRWGFGLVGGVYYTVAPRVDLFLDLQYGFGTYEIEGFEDEAKLDTLRMHLGVVYRFSL